MYRPSHLSFVPPLWFFSIAFVALAVWIMVQVQELMLFLLIAYCIAYLINPIVQRFEARGMPRPIAVLSVFALICCGGAALLLTIVPSLVEEMSILLSQLPSFVDIARERLISLADTLEHRFPGRSMQVVEELRERFTPSGEHVRTVFGTVANALMGGLSMTLFVANLALLPFIAFYLSVDFDRAHRSLLEWLPFRHRRAVGETVRDVDRAVSAYVRGQFLVASILACLYAIGLWTIGVKLWFPVALVAGYGNLIPYIGTLCGVVLSVTMALVTFGTWASVALVGGLFAVVSFLEGMVIAPRILGESLGLSPLSIMVALIIGGTIAGLLGLFLAVPVAAILKVILPRVYRWALA